MQNNVTELTHRLLAALDSNYNVIDMPAVVEIVSLLEKVKITKELLETTRLGKHVNELRRRTENESLSRRAKELVRKWRSLVLPADSNGQLKSTEKRRLEESGNVPPLTVKRARPNGQSNPEFELSDNSNSSMKDVKKEQVILINSDSNSSMPEPTNVKQEHNQQEPLLDPPQPKKRGRKKGSKNHRNLVDEAETSFTNKLAVSRANSKVKTTQELIASLQNKTIACSPIKTREDLSVRAAKLTERVSIIDQKLNTNANRYKSKLQTKITLFDHKNDRVIESGSVINDKSLLQSIQDEDVIVVDDIDEENPEEKSVETAVEEALKFEEEVKVEDAVKITSKTVEECLALLPPIDESIFEDDGSRDVCTCILKEAHHDDDDVDERPVYEFLEDPNCESRLKYEGDRQKSAVTTDELHSKLIENVNGNWGVGKCKPGPKMTEDNLYVNIVPNVNTESIAKEVCSENYNKYSISECDNSGDVVTDDRVFREWHEVLDTPSYSGEIFKILPYVIID